MNLDYPADAEEFREEIRTVLREELPADWAGVGAIPDTAEAEAFVDSWRAVLHRRRLLGITWPEEYGGRGLTKLHQVVLMEELARAGVPAGGPNDNFGIKMAGNTLLMWGSEEQKRHLLPRILSGEERWCQGYSEPGAGSDLASLRTRAVARRRPWVLDGQKIWTSGRTGRTGSSSSPAPTPTPASTAASRSCSSPMDQPGVEVRPIRSATGESEFNEVFFDGARTPVDNLVGAGATGGGRWRRPCWATSAATKRRPTRSSSAPSSTGWWIWPGASAAPTTRSSATGSPNCSSRSRSCASSGSGC